MNWSLLVKRNSRNLIIRFRTTFEDFEVFPLRALQKILLNWKLLTYILIFTLLCVASKAYVKAFIKLFEAPQGSVKIKKLSYFLLFVHDQDGKD